MQSYYPPENQSADLPEGLIHTAATVPNADYSASDESTQPVSEPTRFYSKFVDSMEMYADRQTVSQYFDVHHEWFRRCAHPMKAELIGANSYALVIGKYGSFGYEVEPKIGLDLLPQEAGIYRIETVPVPGYTTKGYDVDFRAAMELVELSTQEMTTVATQVPLPDKITQVRWELDLTVFIEFPRFIHALPKNLIQHTGDRMLQQVVKQVSRRLTRKVLDDFHQSHGLPIPNQSKLKFFKSQENELNSKADDLDE